jgi:hypothetical protein
MNQPDQNAHRVAFFRQLQQLTTRIHATHKIDEIMLDLSGDICELFEADRLTIYSLDEDKASMVSKVKTGLASFKQLKLPISAQSIAGYAALSRKMLNLRDVYDDAELKSHAVELRFQQGVDKRTGYRTRQMLVAPILGNDEVIGVVQLINNRHGGTFSELVEEGMRHLCETLSIAFAQRHKAPVQDRARFVSAIKESELPREQVEHALRLAAATNTDIEDVLLNESGVKAAVIGRALADYFGVPYLGFHPERRRPAELLKNFNRDFVLENAWLPVEQNQHGVYILCTDPDYIKRSGAVARIFPNTRIVYCVTTRREFGWMVNQYFATQPQQPDAPGVAPLPQQEVAALSPSNQQALVKAVTSLVADAQRQGLSDLRIETTPGAQPGEVRFTVSGTMRLP